MVSDNGGTPTGQPALEPTLAGFRELTEIGRGGSSVVYRAWQSSFERWVAIKVLTIAPGSVPLSQFERERRALGALSGHPNIVTVHDAGVDSRCRAYIVMEYLPDGTLAEELGGGPLHWSDAATVGVVLSGALESAHRAGVLHLDVKPENVFRVRHYDTVKLADFGIARIAGTSETVSGTLSGTLAHLAPERLEAQSPTAASDVYSLGSTLFTLVTGHPPFGRAHEAPGEVMSRILRERVDVSELASRSASPGFCEIVERALAKDPGERPATAGGLGEQLRAVQAAAGLAVSPMLVRDPLAGDPAPVLTSDESSPHAEETVPPAPTPPDLQDDDSQLTAPARRKRILVGASAGVVVVTALLAIAFLRSGWSRPPSDGDRPVTSLSDASRSQPVKAFYDDFSNRSTGWTVARDVAEYDDEGGYRIRVDTDHNRVIGSPRKTGNPVLTALAAPGVHLRVEADARFLTNTNGGAGLYCRMQPESRDRYQAVIFPNGYWQFTRDKRGSADLLTSGETTLPKSGDWYHIRFECSGDAERTTLRLEVGGKYLGEWTDPAGLQGGDTGVVAVTATAPNVQVQFDNFAAAAF